MLDGFMYKMLCKLPGGESGWGMGGPIQLRLVGESEEIPKGDAQRFAVEEGINYTSPQNFCFSPLYRHSLITNVLIFLHTVLHINSLGLLSLHSVSYHVARILLSVPTAMVT